MLLILSFFLLKNWPWRITPWLKRLLSRMFHIYFPIVITDECTPLSLTLSSFLSKMEWVLWHVILSAAIIVCIVGAIICPHDIQSYECAHGLWLDSSICSSGALNACEWENKWKSQNTWLTGIRKDSQWKCEMASHLNTCTPQSAADLCEEDPVHAFTLLEAVETKQIFSVSERKNVHQKTSRWTLRPPLQGVSTGGRYGIM